MSLHQLRLGGLYYPVTLTVLVYGVAFYHLFEAQKRQEDGQERDRAFLNRIGFWTLLLAVLLSLWVIVDFFTL